MSFVTTAADEERNAHKGEASGGRFRNLSARNLFDGKRSADQIHGGSLIEA